MSRQYCATCQVSKVTRVKSLSKSQIGPYICYFNYISVHLKKLNIFILTFYKFLKKLYI